MSIPRMRGLKEAVTILHEEDSGCALTLYALRQMVADGSVPVVRVGRRVLINMEVLYQYLNTLPETPSESCGRAVSRIG